MTVSAEVVPIADGNPHPLGRHQVHDSRSLDFPAALAQTYKTVWWAHQGHAGLAGVQAVAAGVVGRVLAGEGVELRGPAVGPQGVGLGEDAAAAVERARHEAVDEGVARARADLALVEHLEFGWLKGYTHAFGLDECLRALTLGPVMIGIPWYSGMFTPSRAGILSVTGSLAGGHEVALTAITPSGMVRMQNSWGARWGQNGCAYLRFADLGTLLAQNGDCTVPVSVQ